VKYVSMPSSPILGRRIVACIIVSMCIVLSGVNTFALFALSTSHRSFTPLLGLQIASSLFISFAFLAVGLLVWLFALDRRVAQYVAAFTGVLAVCFASVDGGLSFNPTFASISDLVSSASAALSVPFLALFLFHFPVNYFSVERRKTQPVRVRLLQSYVAFLVFLCVTVIAILVGRAFPGMNLSLFTAYGDAIKASYYLFGITGIFGASIVSSHASGQDRRTRQQFRLLAGGVVLSLLPVLLLAVLPSLITGATHVDGRISSLALVILAISLGYAVLRYQILTMDTYIRRIASALVGSVGLSIVVYLTLTLNSILSSQRISFAAFCSVVFLGILSPFVWSRARGVTDRLFFPDVLHYRRLLEKPTTLLGDETLTLDKAAELVTLSAVTTFDTRRVVFLALNVNGDAFIACPPLQLDDANDFLRNEVLQRVTHLLSYDPDVREKGIPLHVAALEQLREASRPLVLSELLRGQEAAPSGLDRFFASDSTHGDDILFAPVRAQGKMIGILILGERANQHRYAGPDFDIVQLLLNRFAEAVSTAYLTQELHVYNEQLREKNEQLQTAFERQKELDLLKDEFIMIASHELRTPLTGVQGYIELLKEYNGMDEVLPAAERAKFLEKASMGCDDLTLLIGNMTAAIDIEKKTGQLTLKDTLLREKVVNVVEILGALAEQESHTITVSIDPDIRVVADEQRLGQVLRNLAGNAIKYSSSTTAIEISASTQQEKATISVRDYGKGIPPEDKKKLFNRFVRLERDMNSPTRGSGLGLYITKQLVEAMGGNIWVESSGIEGEGSTFQFTLPLVKSRVATNSREEVHV